MPNDRPWYETGFDADYPLMQTFEESKTEIQATSAEWLLNLNPRARILDLCCGYGLSRLPLNSGRTPARQRRVGARVRAIRPWSPKGYVRRTKTSNSQTSSPPPPPWPSPLLSLSLGGPPRRENFPAQSSPQNRRRSRRTRRDRPIPEGK